MKTTVDLTILTASIPSRADRLVQALESVRNQTYLPLAHRIGVDISHAGPQDTYNALLAGVTTSYVMLLDDDDLLDPHHVEALWGFDSDVTYSWCRHDPPTGGWQAYNAPFSYEDLEANSTVPICALVKSDVLRRAGGVPYVHAYDWAMWRRIASQGGTFRAVPHVTWTYRLNADGNRSHGNLRLD